jgi:tRNA1Val (adenine37-N6)-methyltransferase
MRRRRSSHDSIPSGAAGSVRDALFAGRLPIWQPVRGYRVNVDTLLLASFAAACRPRARSVVDLGSGVGALGLCYAFLGDALRIDFVERDDALSVLARLNLADLRHAGDVHVADLTSEGLPGELCGRADVVLSNPPFFEAHARRGSTDLARCGPVAPFLRAASASLGRRAAAFFAYPAAALPELFTQAGATGLVPKRLRLVHAYPASAARLALVEFRRAKPGGLVVDPPLVEWESRGVRSPELEALVSGKP